MTRVTCCLVLALISQRIDSESFFNFIVWNVGQGSWSTFVDHDCYHFDMGGEKAPEKTVKQLCQNKMNWIFITHDDWDHINKIKNFTRAIESFCLYHPKKSRYAFLNLLPRCPHPPPLIKILSTGNLIKKSRNASSLVYLIAQQILITGDAPKAEELMWLPRLPSQPIRLLLLGHHGSKTSTSQQLVAKIQPKMAIASARHKKYGHPHRSVLQTLKKQRVPVLTTETLGSIYFQMSF